MMKRILTFAAAVVAAVSFSSCDKDSKPTVEFEKSLYVLSESPSVDVTVTVSEPASSDLIVPLSFSGSAALDKDFTVSATSVTISAGQKSGSVTVTNTAISSSSTAELAATVSLSVPAGYSAGGKSTAVLSIVPKETIVYSFKTESADVLGSYKTRISLSGSVSGSSLTVAEDVSIPLTVSGAAASSLVFNNGIPQAVMKAGTNYANVEFSLSGEYEDGAQVVIGVDSKSEPRFIPGDHETLTVSLYSIKVPEGTYKFSKTFDVEELKEFFEMEDDDPAALPLSNEGFTLTFSTDEDGTHFVEPGGTGDFAAFFRKSSFVPATPKNYSSEGVVTGKYTVSECTMFMASDGYEEHTNTYYELEAANRAFSKTKESIGKAVIVFTVIGDDLVVEFRDYDKPSFGENWAGGWTKFDPDMFGFASLFVKQ